MSDIEQSQPDTAPCSPRHGLPASLGLGALRLTLVGERLLFGAMFTISGSFWLTRLGDEGAYLVEQINLGLATHPPIASYRAFLETAVLPNAGLFTFLVGAGELLSGLALLSGFPPRAGAAGGIFLALNYAVAFNNGFWPPSGNVILALVLAPLLGGFAYERWAIRVPGSAPFGVGSGSPPV